MSFKSLITFSTSSEKTYKDWSSYEKPATFPLNSPSSSIKQKRMDAEYPGPSEISSKSSFKFLPVLKARIASNKIFPIIKFSLFSNNLALSKFNLFQFKIRFDITSVITSKYLYI